MITGSSAPEFPGHRTSRRRARVRRADGAAGLGVPHRAARGRTGQRNLGRGSVARPHRRQRVVDDGGGRRAGLVFLPIGSASYDFYGGDRKGQNLYANASSRSMRRPGACAGSFRPSTTISGTTTSPRSRCSSQSGMKAGASMPSRRSPRPDSFTCSIARRGGRCFRSRSGRARRAGARRSGVADAAFSSQAAASCAHSAGDAHELSDVTPESRRYCEALFDRVVSGGIFTPHGEKLTLVFPGNLGGATWSGAAFDPLERLLVRQRQRARRGRRNAQAGDRRATAARSDLPRGEYARFWDEKRWPCQKPPWGTLNAVNLHDGSIAWRVPLGIVEELAEKGLTGHGHAEPRRRHRHRRRAGLYRRDERQPDARVRHAHRSDAVGDDAARERPRDADDVSGSAKRQAICRDRGRRRRVSESPRTRMPSSPFL